MSRNPNINIRKPPPIPQNLSGSTWPIARAPIHRILQWLLDYTVGIPGGFKDEDPTDIQAGVDADPGAQGDGWASASHTHHVETAAPDALVLGQVSDEGDGTALVRADAHPDTIGLAAQVLALVSLRLS